MSQTLEQRNTTVSTLFWTAIISPFAIALLGFFTNFSFTVNSWGSAILLVGIVDMLIIAGACLTAILIESTPHVGSPIGMRPMSDISPTAIRFQVFPDDNRVITNMAAEHHPGTRNRLRPSARSILNPTALVDGGNGGADGTPHSVQLDFYVYPYGGIRGLGLITQIGREGVLMAPGKNATITMGDQERGAKWLFTMFTPEPLDRDAIPGEIIDQLKGYRRFDEEKTPVWLLGKMDPRFEDWLVAEREFIEDVWRRRAGEKPNHDFFTDHDYKALWLDSTRQLATMKVLNNSLRDELLREREGSRMGTARHMRVQSSGLGFRTPSVESSSVRRQEFEDNQP